MTEKTYNHYQIRGAPGQKVERPDDEPITKAKAEWFHFPSKATNAFPKGSNQHTLSVSAGIKSH